MTYLALGVCIISPILASALSLAPGQSEQAVFFSPNFCRHIVVDLPNGGGDARPLQAFQWLDQAESQFPRARRIIGVDTPRLEDVTGIGTLEPEDYYESCEVYDVPLSAIGQPDPIVTESANQLMESLNSKLGSSFLSFFPPSEHPFVIERIQYLLQPISGDEEQSFDTKSAMPTKTGVGLSVPLATMAILSLPHLLSIVDSEVSSKRPPIEYFLRQLKVPFALLEAARNHLPEYLTGASPEDVATIAYLNSIGVSWDQCRVLLDAFSMTFLTCELDPSWELQERGPVKRRLSPEPLVYLRNMLNLTPADIFAMIKTHSRLSSYSKPMLKSHLRALQSTFGLSARELRQIAVRQPALLGTSPQKLEKMHLFFTNQRKLKKKWPCY